MNDLSNSGTWLACGVLCIWPLIVSALAIAVERRVRTHGWQSLLPRGWRRNSQ